MSNSPARREQTTPLGRRRTVRVQDWFAAQLAITDAEMQLRLLVESFEARDTRVTIRRTKDHVPGGFGFTLHDDKNGVNTQCLTLVFETQTECD